MADFLSKLTGFIIPTVEEEEQIDEAQEGRAKAQSVQGASAGQRVKVGNGADIQYGDYEEEYSSPVKTQKPQLQVYKHPKMNILVFEPVNFNDTKAAADSLKDAKAVLINFEQTEPSEQVRINDFMCGACYVLDGYVKKVSAQMMLYVPHGVAVESITPIKKR